MMYIYRQSIVICADEVIGICGIYGLLQGHIFCWHIIIHKHCSLLFYLLICNVRHVQGNMQNNVDVYQCLCSHH